ncbi:hypothetical protein TVAGG3_0290870 [Trichomonas vaginalis G3]|uniref:hypothetical protein n=1 Tax=Trichomonas vaginalis (strain ATCC PRA-98 / G3) TaxID=412133 RepID=UPI0021E559A9|nr:hypothetical protein TVAGG3_0290870 [Trichomonas vaginalis G3]KAI5527259.1 hypothetical protein TVAGG3_0290870 [Trichomonas vaginalis G3]
MTRKRRIQTFSTSIEHSLVRFSDMSTGTQGVARLNVYAILFSSSARQRKTTTSTMRSSGEMSRSTIYFANTLYKAAI